MRNLLPTFYIAVPYWPCGQSNDKLFSVIRVDGLDVIEKIQIIW